MSDSEYEYSEEESFEYDSGNDSEEVETGPEIEIQNAFHLADGEGCWQCYTAFLLCDQGSFRQTRKARGRRRPLNSTIKL